MFDIVISDDKIVNLTTAFGDHFPKTSNILTLKSYNEDSALPLVSTKKEEIEESVNPEDVHINGSRADELNSSMSHCGRDMNANRMLDATDHKFVRMYLSPHEGLETDDSPFSILPKQMVSHLYIQCAHVNMNLPFHMVLGVFSTPTYFLVMVYPYIYVLCVLYGHSCVSFITFLMSLMA